MSAKAALLALTEQFTAHNQGHVFQGVDIEALTESEAQLMAASLSSLDLPYLKAKFDELAAGTPPIEITPFIQGIDADSLSPERRTELRSKGLQLIADGKVAVILLAGGQGSRLGFNLPKGMFPVGLPSGKRIFDLHGERLLRLRELASPTARLPWLVMTSPATHDDTVAYFTKPVGEEGGPTFSYPSEDLFFFQQGALPALDFEGRILISGPGAPVLAPNGNGGIYKALATSGLAALLQARGVEYVHVIGVDNIMAKPADPAMIGYAAEAGLDVVNKVVPKKHAAERVGVMALKNGAAAIVEYTELAATESARVDADGKLLFGAANIASHLYSMRFLSQAVARADDLPWHVARKKVPFYIHGSGVTVPASENGIKMEMFIFDVFSWADVAKVGTFSVSRELEFAPVKNAPVPLDGSALAAARPGSVRTAADGSVFIRPLLSEVTADSPHSAVLLLGAAHAHALEAAGARVAETEPVAAVGAVGANTVVRVSVEPAAEVSPRVAYDEDDLAGLGGVKGAVLAVPALITAAL